MWEQVRRAEAACDTVEAATTRPRSTQVSPGFVLWVVQPPLPLQLDPDRSCDLALVDGPTGLAASVALTIRRRRPAAAGR